MTGKERIQSVLNGKWTDRRPVMLHNFLMAAQEAGLSQKQFRSNPKKAAQAFIDAAEKYGTDGILVDIDTATLAGAAGVPVDFPDDEPARVNGSRIENITDAWHLQPVDLEKDERIQIWLETCRLVKKWFGEEKFLRGNCDQAPFSLACMIRGSQEWMMDLLGDEGPVKALLDYATTMSQDFLSLMATTGVDMVSNGDSLAGPEMIAPEMYHRFAFPYEKKMVARAHHHSLPYCLHICGNTEPILVSMVETGADCLELDYKTSIHMVREAFFGHRTVFLGNIDPSGVLALGDRNLVRNKTIELLDIYKDSPRLIVNAGCALPPITPEENIFQLIESVSEYSNE
jgi:uroporphyrinogen decarboxylase